MHSSFERTANRKKRGRLSTRQQYRSQLARKITWFETLEPRVVLSATSDLSPTAVAEQSGGWTATPDGYTPAVIRHAYGIDSVNFGAQAGDGTGQTIAIIGAYGYPNIQTDLAAFDAYYKLPDPPSFHVVAEDGSNNLPKPQSGGTASQEIALDVEWSHAIAPKANILLVLANSESLSDLIAAADYARHQPGVTVVSMSFGFPESMTGAQETLDDKIFTTPAGHVGVTFIAATGDVGVPAQGYPGFSPNVLAVGGTTLTVDAAGNYVSETGWSYSAADPTEASGGGVSAFELQPYYQSGVAKVGGALRTIPDVSFDADPSTGVSFYDTQDSPSATTPWMTNGGTSFAAPAWAAMIAIADQGRVAAGLGSLDGPTQTLPLIYSLPSSDFHDITRGSNGYAATQGYDLVTGRGSPYANLVIPALAQGTPPGTPNQKYVELTYEQLAGRAVDTLSATLWVNELNAGVSRQTVAEQMLANHYSEVNVVDYLYQKYMHRQADPTAENYLAALLAGGVSVEYVSAILIGSQEYYETRGGGTNNGFLAAVYEDVLGRGIDPSGQLFFSDELAQGRTREHVAHDVLTSDEYKYVVVDYLYTTYLGRAPDSVGLAGWTNYLKQGASDQAVLAGILASDEYFHHIGA